MTVPIGQDDQSSHPRSYQAGRAPSWLLLRLERGARVRGHPQDSSLTEHLKPVTGRQASAERQPREGKSKPTQIFTLILP